MAYVVGWRWLAFTGLGLVGTGLVSCGQAASTPPVSSVTSVSVPAEETAEASDTETPPAELLAAPMCEQLIQLYDQGKIEDAIALENDLMAGNASLTTRGTLGAECSKMLQEKTSMALVDVSLILDEQEGGGTVSDGTLEKLTRGECWLLSGAYTSEDAMVGDIFADDLSADNVVGRHCASIFQEAGEQEFYTPLVAAVTDKAELSMQDCWLLRGAYDLEVAAVKETLGDEPADRSELQTCEAEFKG